jgi:hypothetical protein
VATSAVIFAGFRVLPHPQTVARMFRSPPVIRIVQSVDGVVLAVSRAATARARGGGGFHRRR